MSTYGRNPWGGALEIHPADSTTEDDRSRNSHDFDRATISRPLDETQQSWLLGPREKKKKRYVDLGCIMISRKIFCWIIGTLVVAGFLSGIITLIAKTIPRHHRAKPLPDNYTIALHKALLFFNAQRSGKLPIHNNVSWRSNSCLNDGKSDKSWSVSKDLVGGYYDAGDAIKFHFPASFAMTMLSWSVIEYSSKYESVGELDHVKGIIKWGTDYFLKTFNSSANSTNVIASQVGEGSTYTKNPNDHNCWMRPENINYPRPVSQCTQSCSDLAAEMASALASASIVFKDDTVYSRKLVRAAKILFKFATDQKGRYSTSGDASKFYNSTGFWDEFLWGGAWLYYATGNSTYLDFATKSENVENSGFVYGGGDSSVLSWDNKLPGALLLLSRLRLFLSPGYPYEEMLKKFHDKTNLIMCSYLPYFKSFNRTRAGMIQLNHGRPQPLQYVVNAAFLATLYSDYLEATFTPGWYCGPTYYPKETLREFATAQIDYILWKNPKRMSYVVGYGNTFPRHVHHRGASIPKEEGNKYGCSGGKWKNSPKPNPNVIMGAMVAGPDGKDNYHDIRANYNYTEPTLAGNAGLVAAAVALTSNEEAKAGIDKNTMFSAVPPFYPVSPSPPPPWNPDP